MPPSLKNVLSSEYFLNHFSSRSNDRGKPENDSIIQETDTVQLEQNTELGVYIHIWNYADWILIEY